MLFCLCNEKLTVNDVHTHSSICLFFQIVLFLLFEFCAVKNKWPINKCILHNLREKDTIDDGDNYYNVPHHSVVSQLQQPTNIL